MINPNEPAFPDPLRGAEQSFLNQSPHKEPLGLTKLEYATFQMAKGLLSALDKPLELDENQRQIISIQSVMLANTIILRLNNQPTNDKP